MPGEWAYLVPFPLQVSFFEYLARAAERRLTIGPLAGALHGFRVAPPGRRSNIHVSKVLVAGRLGAAEESLYVSFALDSCKLFRVAQPTTRKTPLEGSWRIGVKRHRQGIPNHLLFAIRGA